MVHYMGVEMDATLEVGAQMVRDNKDPALFDDWEAVLEQRDPQHIFSKVVARRQQGMVFTYICVLDGIVGMTTVGPTIKATWHATLLFKWKTLSDRQQALIHAYLDELPVKKEDEKK
jgi:hypothetical protein